MSKRIVRISRSRNKIHQTQHRFEHWLVDNQVYFITARCRDKFPAFALEVAKQIFWEKFELYTKEFGFVTYARERGVGGRDCSGARVGGISGRSAVQAV